MDQSNTNKSSIILISRTEESWEHFWIPHINTEFLTQPGHRVQLWRNKGSDEKRKGTGKILMI